MFETSETTEKLDAALAKAQGMVKSAVKDAKNSHLGNRYADLASIWDACREALVACNISVSQWPLHSDDERLHLMTRLACDGQWMRARFSVPADKQTAQGYGSSTTYARRYALAAAVGVVADDDDDGNHASNVAQQMSPAQRNQFAATALDECKTILASIKSTEDLDSNTKRLHELNWRNATERKEGVGLVQAKRVELTTAKVATAPQICRACDAPNGKPHAKDCPDDPKNAPKDVA